MADETVNNKTKLVQLQEQYNKLKNAEAEDTSTIARYHRQIKEDWEGIMTSAEEEQLLAAKRAESQKKELKTLLRQLEAKTLLTDLSDEELTKHKEIVVNINEQLDALDEIIDKGKDIRDIYNDVSDSSNYILENFVGINGKSKKFAQTLEKVGGTSNYLKKTIGGVAKQLTASNLKAAALLKIFEKLSSYASTAKRLTIDPVTDALDINKATELAYKRLDEFRASARELQLVDPGEIESFQKRMFQLSDTALGTTEDFININKTLHQTSNIFRELEQSAPAAATGMIQFANTMERSFKVPAQDTAALLDHVSHMMGLGATEAQQFTAEMSVMADNLGLNVIEAMKGFQQQSGNLAKFGLPNMRSEFLKLSKISQQTGLGIDTIVGSLDGLATFEGALTAASKINAVFGTTLDGLELAETIDMEGPVAAFIKLKEGLGGIDISSIKSRSRLNTLATSIGLTSDQLLKMDQVGVESLQSIANEALTVEGAMEKVNSMSERSDLTSEKLARTQDEAAKNMHSVAQVMESVTRASANWAETSSKLAMALNELSSILTLLAGAAVIGIAGKMLMATKAATGFMAAVKGALGLKAAAGAAGGASTVAGGTAAVGGVTAAGLAGTTGALAGGAAIGTGIGMGINKLLDWGTGGAYGNYEGQDMFNFRNVFAPGNTFVSKSQTAEVGDAGAELHEKRTQTSLEAGDRLTKVSAGGSSQPIQITINMVTKDGKNLFSQVLDPINLNGQVQKIVRATLDKDFSLIYD